MNMHSKPEKVQTVNNLSLTKRQERQIGIAMLAIVFAVVLFLIALFVFGPSNYIGLIAIGGVSVPLFGVVIVLTIKLNRLNSKYFDLQNPQIAGPPSQA